jgi:micrococcal nuclease
MTFPMMASKGRVLLWSAAFVLLWAAPAHAADFSGHVVSILDCDTIEILRHQRHERIRLSGIDCPEKGQAYGNNAKHAASDLAFGKEVTLQTHGHDKYGRTLADVFLLDGTNVNHTLVEDGWCWWDRKYAPGKHGVGRVREGCMRSQERLWVIVSSHKFFPFFFRCLTNSVGSGQLCP